ncbi:hypothetical protein SmaMPs15_000254 [Stenotrophomonas maltophilia phage vB_SmaM_Ps15]|uniref:Uncharacterized protein n=1 Tax=Stenotrophomonas maltophilia phage vB_SmaM_Ps15 TaxID=3071007 RepID=A0AAE9FLY6_9CAUD|nr:hypothetical protein PQC01_gp224 [Stenotrophomonas maltophilia phage vB_SmaM_Ps15]UMO77405.1 hypothetical protein SmaMPs15_000254 [Stenotrophomonas maltophilia phage vB_SmaM_Ps15]
MSVNLDQLKKELESADRALAARNDAVSLTVSEYLDAKAHLKQIEERFVRLVLHRTEGVLEYNRRANKIADALSEATGFQVSVPTKYEPQSTNILDYIDPEESWSASDSWQSSAVC